MEEPSATLELGDFRTRRLIKMLQFFEPKNDLMDKIESVSDYKGTLTIKSNCRLDDFEELAFKESWQQCNELPENIIFECNGKR